MAILIAWALAPRKARAHVANDLGKTRPLSFVVAGPDETSTAAPRLRRATTRRTTRATSTGRQESVFEAPTASPTQSWSRGAALVRYIFGDDDSSVREPFVLQAALSRNDNEIFLRLADRPVNKAAGLRTVEAALTPAASGRREREAVRLAAGVAVVVPVVRDPNRRIRATPRTPTTQEAAFSRGRQLDCAGKLPFGSKKRLKHAGRHHRTGGRWWRPLRLQPPDVVLDAPS